jgi:hypothetical protein
MVRTGLHKSAKTLTKRQGADKRLPVGRMLATQDAATTLATVKACTLTSLSGDRLPNAKTAQIGLYLPHHINQRAW